MTVENGKTLLYVYYLLYYNPFCLGVFEQISLLGFQWADAVQHLKQYARCRLTWLY